MKALKNDYAKYVNEICTAIESCYADKSELSNIELMRLYAFIGGGICAQGEKAFVVHLTVMLERRFPELKGFSPRNLRRMRDYYRAYENSPDLMQKTQALGWTQNVIILECCGNNEQRAFYVDLVSERNLSKLALIEAIETSTFERSIHEIDTMLSIQTVSEPISNNIANKIKDIATQKKTACEEFVPTCRHLHQGSFMPYRRDAVNNINRIVPGNSFIEKDPSESGIYQRRMGCSFFIKSIGSFIWRSGPPWKDRRWRPPEERTTFGMLLSGWDKEFWKPPESMICFS